MRKESSCLDAFVLLQNIGKVYDEEYGKYVFWNFEKNPSIHDMSSAGVDAKYDVCGEFFWLCATLYRLT